MEKPISSTFSQKILVRKSRIILFVTISLFAFTVDLSSKWYAGYAISEEGQLACPYPECKEAVLSFGTICQNVSNLNYHKDISSEIVKDFFSIRLLNNTGSAFSFLSGHNNFFILFNILFLAGAIYFMTRKKEIPLLPLIAFSMIIGGGMGNFYDRLVHDSVRDFLSFLIPRPWASNPYQYPVFNMADVFICTGAFLYLLDQFIFCKTPEKENALEINMVEKNNGN
ncbi:MAG: signal peptidase II [Planctomycetota bacterium]|nr:MAG: signal peptidase II [Planctomycetota bacterium]